MVVAEKPIIRWWERLPKWVWAVIPIALFLSGLGYAAWKIIYPDPIPPKAYFQHEPIVRLGDTLPFKNLSENADSLCKFTWQIFDKDEREPEYIDNQVVDLEMVMDTFIGSPDKKVWLIAESGNGTERDTSKSSFQIHCPNPPVIRLADNMESNNLELEKAYQFAVLDAENDVDYEWDFGDKNPKKGAEVSHIFAENNFTTCSVKATRKNSKAYCFSTKKLPISFQQSKAFLAYKPLKEDKITPTAYFARGSWFLLALSGIGMLWYLVKWLKRKPAEIEKKDEKEPLIATETPDRGPYYIPFQSRNSWVKIDRSLFRFADVLRLRQAGIRKNININQTIQTTVENGGFPNLAVTTTTRPTEYLFLIDELARESHQTKLFTYLADFLRDRDVLVETFYYKNDLNRLWNAQNKSGISLEILQRLYPNYRVLVFGNGHEFLDPFATEKPKLKKVTSEVLRHWKHRSLLSPLPVVSWNYREKVLYQHFDIFPADLEGLQITSKAFEQGKDEEEHPNYDRWLQQFSPKSTETDVNYRKWRRVTDFENYLKNHPKVLLWLSALAVYPSPNWSLTIAIGKALAPFGVEVNYDNLLLLSRIPFLQNGEWSPKLRMDFLATLPDDVATVARTAVKEELEAIIDQVKNSHAHAEHRDNLAIQNFVIAPKDADSQQVIQELLNANLLSRKQLAELNLGIKKHFEKTEKVAHQATKYAQSKASFAPPAPDLATFLKDNKTEETPPPRPFFTPDFVKGVLLGLLFLIGLLAFWTLNETDKLYQLAYNELPAPTFKKENELRGNWLVSEKIVVDSAVIYNNMGFENSKFYHQSQATNSKSELEARLRAEEKLGNGNLNNTITNISNNLSFENAERNFKNALRVRKDYLLAEHNLAKLYYNEGTRKYHQAIRDTIRTDSLNAAFLLFYKATDVLLDSLLADGYHGMGLTDYYGENYLKADSTLLFIDKNTDKYFFDTLSTIPNLRSLMTIRKEALLDIEELTMQRLVDSLEQAKRIAIKEKERLASLKEQQEQKDTIANNINDQIPQTTKGKKPDYESARVYGVERKYGLWDKNETVILPPTYDRIGNFGEIFPDLAQVGLNKKVGLIDKAGQLVTPLAYDEIRSIYFEKERLQEVAIIRVGSAEGIINASGKVVVAPQYSSIGMRALNRFLVRNGKEEFEVDLEGKRVEDSSTIIQALEDNMKSLPSGTFKMGCTSEQKDCWDAEKPIREVNIRSFKMNKYEVTQEEWRAVMGNNPGHFKDCDKCPVEQVSWDDIQEFLQKLNKITGKNYRLPSEAEWEYAARGNEKYQYAGSNDINEVAWYSGNSDGKNIRKGNGAFANPDGKTQVVGTKKSNGFGLYDMSGNVYEWCQDEWHDNYEDAPVNNDAWISGEGSNRVIRGGSWLNNPQPCRVANRGLSTPADRSHLIGFRLARSL